MGHTVLRLPPYHCQYNAIELIWAQVKGLCFYITFFNKLKLIIKIYCLILFIWLPGHAARHNTLPPFTANKMLGLLNNACKHVTADDWKKVVGKIKKTIEEDWERDKRYDENCDHELIINLQEWSSDSESDIEYDLKRINV